MPSKNISIPLAIATFYAASVFANNAFNKGAPQGAAFVAALIDGAIVFAIIRVIMWGIQKIRGKK